MKVPSLVLNSSVTRKTVLILAASGLLAFSQLSTAASSCKGMEQNTCSSDTSCSWVKSYSTKSGKTIKAYCRNKSIPGSKKTIPDSSAAEKDDKKG